MIPVQIQANAILNMSLVELQQFVETEAMENPALKVEEGSRCPVCGFLTTEHACPICGASMKKIEAAEEKGANEHDYLERAFAAIDEESDYDPFRSVASAMSLNDYLNQQARLVLGGRELRIAEYLIDSLDDDGYFRESLFETAEEFAAAVPEVESVLQIVQSFDPPGIGARDLRECLLIQLRFLAHTGASADSAERIILDHWEDFSRLKLKTIAKKMDMDVSVVQEACAFIKDYLTPRPTCLYRPDFDGLAPRDTPAVVPDVIVRKHGDSFMADVVDYHGHLLGIDPSYEEMYQPIKKGESPLSEEDRKHIAEHVERVMCILEAISLRRKTLARVAAHLAEYQKDFLAHGAQHLKPLRQKDVAAALGVHESTVCRAVASKYCKLPSGEVVSFDMFFDSALPIRNRISHIIAISAAPLSDSEITKKLAEQGVVIARRTVAKYREKLKVLPYQLRAA